MTRKQALRMAQECIEREIRRVAVEANMADVCGATYPAAVAASKRRKTLYDAIATLQQPEQIRMKL